MDEPLRLPPKLDEANILCRVGGDVDSCSVGLRIFGNELDPDVVTAMLGAQPTLSCRKGEIHRGTHYDRIEKQGKWLLSLERTRDKSLQDLINCLLDMLTADVNAWKELNERYRVDLFCGLQLEEWNRGLSLTSGTLQRLAERNLELGLDIYFVGHAHSTE